MATQTFADELLFTSVACACRPNTLEWCATTSCILFASPKTICIAEQTKEGYHRITETVEKAHTGEITCLTLMRGNFAGSDSAEGRFCTGSSSGECALWKLRTSVGNSRVVSVKRIVKNSSIELAKMAAFGGAGGTTQILLATLHFDFIDVQFLGFNGDEVGVAISSLKFRNAIPSTFELSHICGSIVVAVGLSNGMIDIFIAQQGSHSMEKKMSLDLCGRNKSWTRSLAFKQNVVDVGHSDSLSLAAASDGLIKIWHFAGGTQNTLELPIIHQLLKMDQQTFCIKNGHTHSIAVTLDSVLHGQTELIYSLAWHPVKLELLSSGANQTVVRWSYSESQLQQDAIWLPVSRFGDIVGEGVSCYDITYSPCGQFALCHTLLGGFHFWEIGSKGVLPKCFPISGHFGEVADLCWEPNGSFLLTCGADMTTRIFTKHKQFGFFFEIARPQTHGHPVNCLSSLHRNLFVSGSEEKIFRVFQATSSFAQNLEMLADQRQTLGHSIADGCSLRLPITAAFQTELTLTNKSVTEFDGGGGDAGKSDGSGGGLCPMADTLLFTDPPREDQLNKFTLFPEEHKLYGHGFEVFSCASSHDGKVLATSSKASHFEHAGILLWDMVAWKLMNTLKAHQLTVTRLAFSYDDQFLLSVSRDRTWTLFRRPSVSPSAFAYMLFQRTEKAQGHSRIIWDCAWCADAYVFATCSRDKLLKLWSICSKAEEGKHQFGQVATCVGHESMTAVDFSPRKYRESSYLLATGFEDGVISFFDYNPTSRVLQIAFQLPENSAHTGRINRIRFCPVANKEADEKSDDDLIFSHSSVFCVKIHKLKV